MRPAIEPLDQEELERIVEQARSALSAQEYTRLKAAFDTLVYLTQLVENKSTTIARLRQILFGARTEKTAAVLKAVSAALKTDVAPSPTDAADATPARQGHGRNAANTYAGAAQIKVEHPSRHAGERCPECHRGKLYTAATPGVLVRVVGQAPLGASVYELEKLRCNLCLEVFTAPAPEALGSQKYDAGCASMIALLKYGSGVPFHRLDGLQQSLGIPLPASTQWEIVEKSAALVKPAFEELIRQAAQGEVLYNDDTTMKILVQRAAAASNETATEQPETARSQRTGTPRASCPRARGAASRCSSPGAGMLERIWPRCSRIEPRRSAQRSRCATRSRAISAENSKPSSRIAPRTPGASMSMSHRTSPKHANSCRKPWRRCTRTTRAAERAAAHPSNACASTKPTASH
jgi:hypothetical protein